MKRIKIKSILLTGIIIFIVGCSTIKIIHTEKGPEFSITDYKTYDFFEVNINSDDFPEFNKRVDWIKEELIKQLEIKGVKQSTNNPDLLINIGIVVEEKIQTRETDFRTDAPRYMGTRNYSWQSEEVEVGRYHEGTVSLHFVDPANNNLVWRGVAQGVIVKKDEASKKNIAMGAEKLFDKID